MLFNKINGLCYSLPKDKLLELNVFANRIRAMLPTNKIPQTKSSLRHSKNSHHVMLLNHFVYPVITV